MSARPDRREEPTNYRSVNNMPSGRRSVNVNYQMVIREFMPTGNLTIAGVADEIAQRVARLFTRQDNGERAIFGRRPKFQRET